MSIYLHVTMEVREGTLARFNEVMAQAVDLLREQDWKLEGAFIQRTGRLNTVIHIWKLKDFQHYATGGGAYAADPRFGPIRAALDEMMLSETINFASRSPYARPSAACGH
jgi:hypothetical protein